MIPGGDSRADLVARVAALQTPAATAPPAYPERSTMDIICGRCGEPNDNDSIHEEVSERALIGETTTYAEVAAELRSKGCGVALRELYGTGGTPCERVESLRTAAASAMFDLLGDDMDGAASLMEDFEYAGLLG